MKTEILEKLNYILPYIDDFESEYPAMLEVIKMVELLPDPEPLDPYTCELIVGDVVEWMSVKSGITYILVVCNNDDDDFKGFDPTQNNIDFFYRSELKLIHRHGATIKEVGNG